MKRRREVSVFGLSFLDVMFCGFGSVILLVMIINSQTLAQRKEVRQDLRGEVPCAWKRRFSPVRNTWSRSATRWRKSTGKTSVAQGRTREVLNKIDLTKLELAALDKATRAHREHINQLQSDLKRVDSDKQKLASEREQAEKQGRSVRKFTGEGDRQYLTGLKVGGKRILILVDASASMLDETIVNIIRLRNLPDDTKRKAEKWQRAVRTVEWLLSQLPMDSEFQVLVFNIDTKPLAGGGGNTWLAANQNKTLNEVMARLNHLAPSGWNKPVQGYWKASEA